MAGTRPATTLAAKQAAIKAAKQAAIKAAKLAASSAGMPTPLRLLTRPYVCLYAPTSAYCNDWTSGLLSSGLLIVYLSFHSSPLWGGAGGEAGHSPAE